MLGLAEKFVLKETELHRRFVRRGERLREQLNTLLADDGVLIYPSHPSPAPYHNQLLLKPFNFAYTGIFNILGNPVTQVNLYIVSLSSDPPCSQVPLGLNSEGLPLGVQVVAGRNMDRLCLAVAQEVQLMFGGWVPPSACHDKR